MLCNIGATADQMQKASKNAVYVWCNNHLYYPKELAKALQRTDLTIQPPSWLASYGWAGLRRPVVFDHAFGTAEKITKDQWDGYFRLNAYMKAHGRRV